MNDARAYMIGKRLIEAGRSPDPATIADPASDLKALLRGMRIIGGSLRGLTLAPVGKGDAEAHLRPTSDRVRESIFNLLINGGYGNPVAGARVLGPVRRHRRAGAGGAVARGGACEFRRERQTGPDTDPPQYRADPDRRRDRDLPPERGAVGRKQRTAA